MLILLIIINILLVVLAFVVIMRAIKCAVKHVTDEIEQRYVQGRNGIIIHLTDLNQRIDQLKRQFSTICGITIASPVEGAAEVGMGTCVETDYNVSLYEKCELDAEGKPVVKRKKK